MTTQYSVLLITAPDQPAAEKLARGLLKARLAACVNTLPVSSTYWWEEKLDSAQEILLLVKTRANLAPEIIEFTRKNHPYSVPEIVALPVSQGNPTYLDWIGANTQFTKPKSPDGKSR